MQCWDALSNNVLALFASPLLGPCKLERLDLSYQREVNTRGICALAGGRFPGAWSHLSR